jgi:hypothetical protein
MTKRQRQIDRLVDILDRLVQIADDLKDEVLPRDTIPFPAEEEYGLDLDAAAVDAIIKEMKAEQRGI